MSETNARLEEDAEARRRAMDLASFIVEAPAGAGKTELLTQRFLRLLGLVEHPEEVLALTFTNKAAAEMRNRILESLDLARAGTPPEAPHKRLTFELGVRVLEQDARRGWTLLQHPGRLRITTIDSLCASLNRQLPLLSRFGGNPGVATDPAPLYEEAARATLDMLEQDGESAFAVEAALRYLNNDSQALRSLLEGMLAKRDQWLRLVHQEHDADFREAVEAGFRALIESDLENCRQRLADAVPGSFFAALRYAADNLAADGEDASLTLLRDIQALPAATVDCLPVWRALAGLLLTKNDGGFRRSFDKRCGFPPGKASQPHKLALSDFLGAKSADDAASLDQIRNLPDAAFAESEWAIVASFIQLLKLAAGHLLLAFQNAGQVDFGEVAARALQALGDDEAGPTDLALALDYRIQHLLVDEFQDTNRSQVELFRRLTSGWQPGDGRTLFLVGDPMQSIYRFRKADVGLFLRVRDHGIGSLRPTPLRLFRNNRSCPAVVDWVNRTFPRVFDAADDPRRAAVRYSECAATRPDAPGAGVQVHPVLANMGDTAAARASQAQQAVAIIQATLREQPDANIAVLVRARAHLAGLVAELRRVAPELRFQAVELERQGERQHIQDLLSLVCALHHRADRVHWLAILRAPWCGLTLADLHALAADDHQRTVWALMNDVQRAARFSADGAVRLERTLKVLAEALDHQGRQSPRRWVEGVWLALDGPRCLVSPTESADIVAFFELIDRLSAAGTFTPENLAKQLDSLYASPDPTADGRLQLMTIHKSKGLEFDTVILPELERSPSARDAELLIWDEILLDVGQEQLLVAPLPSKASGDSVSAPSKHGYLRQWEQERGRRESQRLLYVAVTRAVRTLHLIGGVSYKDGALSKPPKGSLLELLWQDDVRREFEAAAARSGEDAAPEPRSPVVPSDFVPKLVRLKAIGVPTRFAGRSADGWLPTNTRHAAGNGDGAVSPLDAMIGTLLHQCLEFIATDGIEFWPAARPTGLRRAYANWFCSRGLDSKAANAASGEVVEVLTTILASSSGRWLLASRDEARSELAMAREAEGRVVYQVIDRTFVEDGIRWIIDYKFVRTAMPNANFGEFEANFYRPQLERYARLYEGIAAEVKTAVYFLKQDSLVVI